MKKKVLLVDDDATCIFLMKLLLKKHSIVGEVVTATNGFEALDILKSDSKINKLPQVIISDIEMPIMSGISFLRELEKLKLVDYTLTKIVLNSCSCQYHELDWAVEIPHVIYFPKPLIHENLLTLLRD